MARTQVAGERLGFAITELVRSCRDVRASTIRLEHVGPDRTRIVDDGPGMERTQQMAFILASTP